MATVPYVMQPATLTTSPVAYVTCPVNQYLTTKKVTVTNINNVPVTFALYKVPSGGTPGNGNVLIDALTIPASSTNGGVKEIYEAENQILQPGDTLQAFAGVAGVLNLNISGILQTT